MSLIEKNMQVLNLANFLKIKENLEALKNSASEETYDMIDECIDHAKQMSERIQLLQFHNAWFKQREQKARIASQKRKDKDYITIARLKSELKNMPQVVYCEKCQHNKNCESLMHLYEDNYKILFCSLGKETWKKEIK